MLKRFSVALLLSLVAWVAAAAQTPVGWVKFSPPEKYFSVMMPMEPTPNVKTTDDATVGPYTTHLFMVKGDGEIYLAGWVDYAPTFKFSVQAELDANRDKFVEGIKGKLLSTSKITLDGNPGIEFTGEIPGDNPFQFKSRVYIVGRRPIQLIALTRTGENASKVERFLTSFQLGPAK